MALSKLGLQGLKLMSGDSPLFTENRMTSLTRRTLLTAAASTLWCWPREDEEVHPDDASFQLAAPDAASIGVGEPLFVDRFIEHEIEVGYVHCPSLCEVSPGSLVCAWYAGTREGAKDVGVWLSDLGPTTATTPAVDSPVTASASPGAVNAWSVPRVILDREIATRELDRYIRKVGNALLFTDAEQRLWLIYVSIAVGGWSGSSLNARCSLDRGVTWQPSHRLSLSPCFNISELVRAAPIRLASGEIGLPIYHEFVGQFPEMLWLRPSGNQLAATKTRMAGGHSFIQPVIVPMGPKHAIAYLRNLTPDRCIGYQETQDAGRTWTTPRSLSLPNPNSSMAAVRLSNGSVLMAFNDSKDNREDMTLAVSPDGIHDWKRIMTLDRVPQEFFAYPYLIRSSDGMIHLVYSWKMRKVRHVAFNEAWAMRQLNQPLPAAHGDQL
jgi:predicted neuraminidase